MLLTAIILVPLGVFICGAVGAACVSGNHTDKRAAADEVWRVAALRNGVTEPSPFHARESVMNAPAMVRVYPRSHTAPVGTSDQAAAPAPVSVSTALVPTPHPLESPAATEVKRDETPEETPEETTVKPPEIKHGHPRGTHKPDTDRAAAITLLGEMIAGGEMRKTVLAWAVFGASGGNAYAAAKPLITEALENA